MKVRKATVCQECRTRKLGCDGDRPSCSQCRLRGRKCPGYQADLIFRDPLTTQRSYPGQTQKCIIKRSKPTKKIGASPQPIPTHCITLVTRPLSWPLRDIVSLCAQNWVPASELAISSSNLSISQSRICGSWVEVLPSLIDMEDNQQLLSLSIKAFGISILARGTNGIAPVSDALEAKCAAVHALRDTIRHYNPSSFNAMAAAVMCLYLSEVMIPSSHTGSAIHSKGISDLIQLNGPQFYESGIPHKLFAGFRPLLILHAFDTRKSSFLSEDEWKNDPFRVFSKTPLQDLMNEASGLPSLLERLDGSKDGSICDARSVVQEALLQFTYILDNLDLWYQRTTSASTEPIWWPASEMGDGNYMWFPNITMANSLTHYWAFWILCVTYIIKLRAENPWLMNSMTEVDGEAPESQQVSKKMMQMAKWILQSVEFLMQDKMKFFGIASANFPIQTACDVLEAKVGRSASMGGWKYGRVIDKIVQSGYADVVWPAIPAVV